MAMMMRSWLSVACFASSQVVTRRVLVVWEQGMQVLMEREEVIREAEAVVRAEEEETVRDSIMLQVIPCSAFVGASSLLSDALDARCLTVQMVHRCFPCQCRCGRCNLTLSMLDATARASVRRESL